MTFLDLVLIAVGLSMDAFAVSICKGLSMTKMVYKNVLIVGFYFGLFQALMPILGYFLGKNFESLIVNIDHWIAFFLLLFIGLNMIKDSMKKKENYDNKFDAKSMLPLAIATSIDALACGITFVFLKVNIIFAGILIGVITCILSILGVLIGKKFGDKFEKKAQIIGGVILILIGIKILLQHLEII